MRRLFIALFALAFGLLPGRVRAQNDIIKTFAGGGPSNLPAVPVNPNPPQTAANLNQPTSVAVDGSGNIYTASPAQHRVFKVDATGTLTVFAGNGTPGSGNECTQGNSPDCTLTIHTALHSPQAVAVDSSGNVFIADSQNNVVRVVNTQSSAITVAGAQVQPGAIATVAGNGGSGFSGDGGLATDAKLARPFGLAIDSAGNIFIADIDNNRVREVDNATGYIKTVAGNGALGFSGDGGPAVAASLNQPMSVALDSSNPPTLYIGDGGNHRIRRVDPNGVITTFAGNGTSGAGGDGGPATSASLGGRLGLAFYSPAKLFIADADSGKIREVSAGVINTVAGNGCFGYSLETSDCKMNASGGDGNPATSASLDGPLGAAFDGSGNLYIADTGNLRVRAVNNQGGPITLAGVTIQPGDIETLAGNGLTFGGDGSPAADASLNSPQGVTRDNAGNLFMSDTNDQLIRAVNQQASQITLFGVPIQPGKIATVAGNGCFGYALGDFPKCDTSAPEPIAATKTSLGSPTSVAMDGAGNLYIADTSNQRVRKVDAATQLITTLAGTGTGGFNGDGQLASAAELNFPSSVAFDGSGNLFIADTDNQRVRAVNLQTVPVTLFGVLIQPGDIATVAGDGTASSDPTTACAETGAATSAELNFPAGIGFDGSGNLYIADRANYCVRKVDLGGNISTVAGDGTQGFSGDGGAATNAELNLPASVAVDSTGNLYIADFGNQAVRRVDASTQVITTVAGSGVFGFSGDNGPAYLAMLANPSGVALDGSGNLLIADTLNDRIRQVGKPVVAALTLSATSLSFGNELVNVASPEQTVTLTNSGSDTLTISGITVTGDFSQTNNCDGSLAAGASCSIQVTFTPTALGSRTGTLSVSDTTLGSPQAVALSGTGVLPTAAISTMSLIFTSQLVGTSSSPQAVTLQNMGTAPLSISSIVASSGFSETDNCGTSLALGASCTVNVVFSPTSTGTTTGTLTFIDNAAESPQTVYLTGTGIAPAVALAPTSLSFGNQGITTTSAPQGVALTSTGTASLLISSITTTGDFAETNNCGASVPPPTTCTISVTFTPTATGARSGTLTFTDSAANSPQTVALTGTGIGPAFSLSQTSLTFGISQGVGTTSGVLPIALTSTSTAPLLINSITAAGDFAETNNCATPPQTTTTCTISVTFSPTATGARSGTLAILSNVSGPATTVALSGTGVPGYAMTVDRTSATVLKGTDSAVFNVSASSQFNFSGTISLSCAGNPAPACSFNPGNITAGQNSVLTVSGLGPLQSGSLNFTVIGTSGSQSPSVALTIFIADYSLSASATAATVTAGQTATYTLKIQPSGGFNQPISFSCSGAPLAATCSVSPVAVTPDGTNPASATVTVTTTALSSAQVPGPFATRWPRVPGGLPLLLWVITLSGIAVYVGLGQRRVRYLLGSLILAVVGWAACGGGSQLPILKGTPSGSYTLTVTGVSGSLSHNIALTLNVN